MSVRFVQILAVQRPFPIGTDTNGRSVFSCNFDALADSPVDQFEECVLKILNGSGLATKYDGATGLGDTTIGPAARIPDGDGPWVQLIDTGGRPPDESQTSLRESLSIMVQVTGMSFQAAQARALAIWRALHGQRGVTVSP